jgi:hypothetical protein
MTEVLTGALLVVHRDQNELPFVAGWYVYHSETLAHVAGPFPTQEQAETAAGEAQLAARYRRE